MRKMFAAKNTQFRNLKIINAVIKPRRQTNLKVEIVVNSKSA